MGQVCPVASQRNDLFWQLFRPAAFGRL